MNRLRRALHAREHPLMSNDKLARLAGLLYLILVPTTGPAVFSGQLALTADAATTLANTHGAWQRKFFASSVLSLLRRLSAKAMVKRERSGA